MLQTEEILKLWQTIGLLETKLIPFILVYCTDHQTSNSILNSNLSLILECVTVHLYTPYQPVNTASTVSQWGNVEGRGYAHSVTDIQLDWYMIYSVLREALKKAWQRLVFYQTDETSKCVNVFLQRENIKFDQIYVRDICQGFTKILRRIILWISFLDQ